ncbi:RidA family protein [Kribbella yunnanensis]|uniref:RidA family protein n=1 Tax=Kribbella yunnanensis TaxID=190194 RepID=A0ABN2H7X7_9ACTN
MAVTLINPERLPKPDVYRQLSIAQVEQAYLNIGNALKEIGGSFDDVAKLTVYVVDWSPEKFPLLGEGVARAAAILGVDPVKPITLISVGGLGEPDLMVEVEATAVLD